MSLSLPLLERLKEFFRRFRTNGLPRDWVASDAIHAQIPETGPTAGWSVARVSDGRGPTSASDRTAVSVAVDIPPEPLSEIERTSDAIDEPRLSAAGPAMTSAGARAVLSGHEPSDARSLPNAASISSARDRQPPPNSTDRWVPASQIPVRAAAWARVDCHLRTVSVERRPKLTAAGDELEPSEAEALDARLRAGSNMLSSSKDARQGPPIEVVWGIDFGTTSTKVVARLPYEDGVPTFAVPVIRFARAEGHAYLWLSRVWLAPNGAFSLLPLPGAEVFEQIKTNLMARRDGTHVGIANEEGPAVTPAEVATAFLALQIRQAAGWFATAKGVLFRGRPPRWSYNFGFPAASLNDGVLRACYERCVAAAVELAGAPSEITLSLVRSTLATADNSARTWLERQDAALHPEIAAAVAGFAKSSRREDGLYALVDVGGGTVDCCTFNLFAERDGSGRCPIFLAEVELLGVERWRLCQDDAPVAKDFCYLLDTLQTCVIWGTKTDRDPNSPRWRTGLPLFFIGGGISSAEHRASTRELDPWLRRFSPGSGGVRIERLPAPESLQHAECGVDQVHRLGVAIGLSLPAFEIPEVKLPNEIEDVGPAHAASTEDRYIDKDQV